VPTTRAIKQTRQRPARLLARLQPTVPPTMRRRRRDTESGRGRPQRQTILDRAHQREPPSQSELGVSVQIHPRPPLSVSPGRPTASKEGRISPEPFTTSVGGTTSDATRTASLSRRPPPLVKPLVSQRGH